MLKYPTNFSPEQFEIHHAQHKPLKVFLAEQSIKHHDSEKTELSDEEIVERWHEECEEIDKSRGYDYCGSYNEDHRSLPNSHRGDRTNLGSIF